LWVIATMVCGSTASTTVVSSSRARTTTLQGRSNPMDGSACRAAWASGGRHAPRITWAGTSTSSFALSVAAMSISVSTPKPCSPSAARTASTVSP